MCTRAHSVQLTRKRACTQTDCRAMEKLQDKLLKMFGRELDYGEFLELVGSNVDGGGKIQVLCTHTHTHTQSHTPPCNVLVRACVCVCVYVCVCVREHAAFHAIK